MSETPVTGSTPGNSGESHAAARVLGADAAVAVGRFSPEGVEGFRAKSGGQLRATRAEAEADELSRLDGAAGCTCEVLVTDLDCPVHGWQEIAPGVKAVLDAS